jgi:hypothetical protein
MSSNDCHLPSPAAAMLLLLYGPEDWPFQWVRRPYYLMGEITVSDSSATDDRQRWAQPTEIAER